MNKKIVLLDVDRTIIDTDAYKRDAEIIIDDNYGEGASKEFREVEEEVKKELGVFDLKETAMRFANRRNSPDWASAVAAYIDIDYKNYWLDGALDLLQFLSKNFRLIIFTKGHEFFQTPKVQKLELIKFTKEIIIARSKIDLLDKIKKDYVGEFIVIDDSLEVLEAAKKALDAKLTVQVKIKDSETSQDLFKPDFIAKDLKSVIKHLKAQYHLD